MTYKVRVRPRDVEIEFEVGSIGEAVGVLESEKNAIGALFAAAPWAGDQAQSTTLNGNVEPSGETTTAPTKGRRGPNKAKNQPDPASASAPPPIPVTAPAAPAPVAPPPPPMPPAAAPPIAPAAPPMPGADMGIPAFLKREAPPAPPVGGRLGGLVKAELEKRAPDETSKASWAKWLADSGLVLEGATFAEAIACVSVEKDDNDQLKEVAKVLGIS